MSISRVGGIVSRLEKAPIEKYYTFKGFEDVDAGIVKWPMSVIRLTHDDPDKLTELAGRDFICVAKVFG